MKKHFTLITATLYAGITLAGDFSGSISLQGASATNALKIYAQLSSKELAIEPAVTNVYRPINLEMQAASKNDALKSLEAALRTQDKIVITSLDDKHASVTMERK